MGPDNQYRYNRVMIIEDSPVDRYIAVKLVERNSFAREIVCMETGTDAFSYLRSPENKDAFPDIILLDIWMPDINGFQFLDMFENLPEEQKKSCTIIMISSTADPRDHQKMKDNNNVFCFIHKPLTKEKLLSIGQPGSDKVCC